MYTMSYLGTSWIEYPLDMSIIFNSIEYLQKKIMNMINNHIMDGNQ